MRVRRGRKRAVVTIGMFDGVHVGHQQLIRTTVRWAKRLGADSVVMTFDPDPQVVLDPHHAQPRLMSLQARRRLIETLGVDRVWVMPFTRAFSRISAEQFVRTLLVERLRVCGVVVGPNFTFGWRRRGTLGLLRRLGGRYGFRVIVVAPVIRDGRPVSSSRIRRLIERGQVTQARRLLGRPVQLHGTVIHGDRRARHLGFPTANVRLADALWPARGVYRVQLEWRGRRVDGLMNLGLRPTFASSNPSGAPLVCEVHLAGFRAMLYSRAVTLHVLDWIRRERRFRSGRALARQIHRDLAKTHLLK